MTLRELQKESARVLATIDSTSVGLSKFNKLAHHNSLNWYKAVIQSYIDQYGDLDEVAALCSALDVVVSTKATPPMVSAGVGTLTKIANWRQSNFNNILTNPQSKALEMIHRDTLEPWDNVFNLIADEIKKIALHRV